MVAARRLLHRSMACEAWLVGRRRDLSGNAALAASAFVAAGGRLREQWAAHPIPRDVQLVIDGLLGAGVSRAPEGLLARAIRAANAARARGVRVVAVDVPSGLSTDTGTAPGAHIQADVTVTFQPLKIGLCQDGAMDAIGERVVVDIGIPQSPLDALDGPRLHAIDLTELAHRLGSRPKSAFKNTLGHVLCIGGSPGKSGSIALTALAALRTGAGLATVCSRPDELRAAQAFGPEIMGWELPGNGPLGLKDEDALAAAMEGKQAVVCGPGLFRGPETASLLRRLLRRSTVPWLLDADGLNAWGAVDSLPTATVLTPHPGEAARLLGDRSSREIQADRLGSALELAKRSGATVVLKGARTLVAERQNVGVSMAGSSLLATAGSGDVLSGIGGALLARGILTPFEAAQLAVAIHAHLPDVLRPRKTAVASDLVAALPLALPC